MNGKKMKTVILAAVLVVLVLGAGILYNRLGEQMQPQALATVPAQTDAPTQPVPEETVGTTEETTEATQAQEPEEEQRQAAPDFTVYDAEGNQVALSQMQGKPVILNFWATWCGYCVAEMPEFQAVFEEYGDQIHFMMVNVTDGFQETQSMAQSFIAEQGFAFPVYYDLELSATNAYGVNAMPVTYFIDADGNFVAWGQGALNKETLLKGVGMLIDVGAQ